MTSTCSTCARPLLPAIGDQTCPYCGTVNRGYGDVLGSTDTKLHKEHAGTSYSRVAGWIGRIVALTACAALVAYLLGIRPKVADAPELAYQPADLHALGDAVTEITPVDPSGLGSLAALDPLAKLPWFLNLARTWSPDARLVVLELHGVKARGSMDVSLPGSDPYARFQFASKGRAAAARQGARASSKPLWSAIDLLVKRGVLRAAVVRSESDDRDPSPVVFGCGIPQLVDTWRAKGLPFKPTYNLELSDLRGDKSDLVWHSADWGVPPIGIDCRLR